MTLTTLFNAVQESSQFDQSDYEQITEHGMAAGFGQFIYYSDTVKFFEENKTAILDQVKELAEALGEDPLSMVARFNCLQGFDLTSFDIAEAIYSDSGECETNIKNALTWFAVEEVAHAVVDGEIEVQTLEGAE